MIDDDGGRQECDDIDEALRPVLAKHNPGELFTRWVLVAEFHRGDGGQRQLAYYRQTSMAPWDEAGFHHAALNNRPEEEDEEAL